MLKIIDVCKTFGGIRALNSVSLEIEKKSIVGLIGPNGSGKSTLFNIISGFLRADSGDIHFKDEKITGLPPYKISQKGLVRTFQISKAPERMTVLENMLLSCNHQIGETVTSGILRRKRIRAQEKENLKKVLSLLEFTGVIHLANEFSGNLSGGQQKLLSLSRIIARDPEMVLLDEPTAGVNPTLTKKFMTFLRELRAKHDKTFFLVEHDMNFISNICDKVFVLDAGIKIAEGTPEQIQKNGRVLEAYLGSRKYTGGMSKR